MRLAALCLMLSAAVAHADDDPPWARGVTAAQKATAQTLLEAGNTLFVEHAYDGALAKYQAALAAWDHPAIRFNIVRCLIQLGHPLEADDQLALALKYGAAPLEDGPYNEALGYQKLLANQVAHVAVSCTQPGVLVTLDGKQVVSCPGAAEARVEPGPHHLVATRDGFVPRSEAMVIVGGKRETVAVTLVPLSSAPVVMVHRWDRWKPWAVLVGGVAVAGVGALIDYQASRDMKSYEDALVGACAGTGCGPKRPVPESVAAQKTSATHESEAGVALLSVGVATAVVGGVLLYLNRDRAEQPSIEVTPHGATIGFSTTF